MSQVPVPGPFRPAPPPSAAARPVPGPAPAGGSSAPTGPDGGGSGHPAVDAVLQAMANAANLPPADQIAQYEAAHQTLRETLATIDQA
ncbi:MULTISPECIES: hypothetical protein [unclassified Plantactinospora]|uniref:hypothetical protein n=1 Tax=unclassified Plantactinospora TaxID=2631981 RepID=UPI000D16BDEF|nr:MULTISPECIES: hypothetical protein [unclassified Plantactinospora]AVT33952.1 hypothetical protein C6361_36040 [Plantactinospora sp. BC1]AVT38672.1 hypothetical protein C6W10_22035 [Plantactinospora sp. BB1]